MPACPMEGVGLRSEQVAVLIHNGRMNVQCDMPPGWAYTKNMRLLDNFTISAPPIRWPDHGLSVARRSLLLVATGYAGYLQLGI
jgi:hypothetical protein